MPPSKFWLLDADIIIDFLSLDVFEKLIEQHDVYISTTVIAEVKYYKKDDVDVEIDFREKFVEPGRVTELSALANEIKEVLLKLPPIQHDAIDAGELESLAVLLREEELMFCSCDAAAIRALPFLDLSERGISAEQLLQTSGLSLNPKKLSEKHTKEYFKNNIGIGKENKVCFFSG